MIWRRSHSRTRACAGRSRRVHRAQFAGPSGIPPDPPGTGRSMERTGPGARWPQSGHKRWPLSRRRSASIGNCQSRPGLDNPRNPRGFRGARVAATQRLDPSKGSQVQILSARQTTKAGRLRPAFVVCRAPPGCGRSPRARLDLRAEGAGCRPWCPAATDPVSPTEGRAGLRTGPSCSIGGPSFCRAPPGWWRRPRGRRDLRAESASSRPSCPAATDPVSPATS